MLTINFLFILRKVLTIVLIFFLIEKWTQPLAGLENFCGSQCTRPPSNPANNPTVDQTHQKRNLLAELKNSPPHDVTIGFQSQTPIPVQVTSISVLPSSNLSPVGHE